MVDERTLRRPTFSGGVPIRFGDGQFWVVPLPVGAEDVADGDGIETLRAAMRLRFGPGYLELLQAIREAEDHDELLRMEMALAIRLLRSNYDLDPSLYERILGFDSDEDLARMQQAMADVARAHLRAAFPAPELSQGSLNEACWERPASGWSFYGPLGRIPQRVLASASNVLSRFNL